MAHCTRYLFSLLAAIGSLGASYRSDHFVVEAADEKIAKQVGETAERWRKDVAVKWLGKELPDKQELIPLRVTITTNGSGGATSFAFDRGKLLSVDMHLEGSLERILHANLPHEITHVILAHHFRTPLPRWADEGAAVLSEDARERSQHETMVQQILDTPGRSIPLRRLFALCEYPRDVMVLYAEGYSVSRFLIEARDRKTFLAFVRDGMTGEWDKACKEHYRYKTVEELEKAWLQGLRAEKRVQQNDPANVRIGILEAEVKLLKLENQLQKNQLAHSRQRAEAKREQDRLEKEIERARQSLEQLRRDAQPPSKPIAPTPSLPAPGPIYPSPANLDPPTVPPSLNRP